MTSGLKQRLIGAAVLIAIAVIFLPMLVKGPAPESGLPDMPMGVPDAPAGAYRTVDLPLVAPGPAPAGSVLGDQSPAPVADTPQADGDALPTVDAGANAAALPATTAGGDYAVHYGAFASDADAKAILRQLGGAGLTGYSEAFTLNGKPAHRVRLGPYASRAEAETIRVRAAQVRNDVTPRVVALDAGATPARPTAAATPAPQPTPAPAAETPRSPAPAPTPATPPAATTEAPVRPATPAATAGVGFIVQVGAFSAAADADKMRDRLRSAGITAFTDSVQTDKGRLTRVKAGPVSSRGEADQLKTRVRSAVGVDGLVRAHP